MRPVRSSSALLLGSLLVACAVVGAAAKTRAQSPDGVLHLEVRADPTELDPEALREALEESLSREVRLGSSGGAELPVLEVTVVDGQLLLRYRERDGELTRITEAPSDRREWLTVATLIGASMVRDDARDLLSMLEVPERDPETPEPEPIEPETIEPDTIEPETIEPDTIEPTARVEAAVAEPVPVEPDPRPLVPFGVDLFPGLGVSTVHGGYERRNVSIGLFADVYGALDGYAFGSFATAGGDVHGVQQSLGVSAAIRVDGVQLGMVNVAAEAVSGAQIGLVNVAGGRVRGPQIGLVNIAESAEVGVGLLNFYTRGHNYLDVTGDSAGSFRLALKHGMGWWHTVYSVGVNPFYGETALMVGVGLGARAELTDLVFLDLEAVTHYSFDTSWQFALSFVSTARALVGIRLVRELAIVVGLGLDLQNTSVPDSPVYAPILASVFPGGVRLWPSVVLGFSAF